MCENPVVDVSINSCVNSNNYRKIETVDISHEIPFTIIKNETIPSINHTRTKESRELSYKASNSQKGKMVKFQYKRKSVENKPLYNNKLEAKKILNRFVSGGTSMHESAKFSNEDCFSHEKFNNKNFYDKESKQQDESKNASTSSDASKYCHKTCLSCNKMGHISRLCNVVKPQQQNNGP